MRPMLVREDPYEFFEDALPAAKAGDAEPPAPVPPKDEA